jgi:outer membrane protease
MRNIPALTVLVIIIYAFAPNYSVFSQNAVKENYGFSISPQAGFIYGQALEYVYPQGETKAEFLSELRWDMKPVYYLGLQFDFGKINVMSSPGFYSSLSFKAGIPFDSGIMEDRDWRSPSSDELTDFSSHTNKTFQFFSLDVSIGASLPVEPYYYVKWFVSSSWMRFVFSGRDGYGKYARKENYSNSNPIDDNPIIYNYSGDVISYMQEWLILSPGVSIGTKILYPFSFDFSFKASVFTYCADQDEHHKKKTTYLDYTSHGLFLEPALCVSYSVKRLEHTLEFSRRYIGIAKGITYVNEYNTGYRLSSNYSGAGLSFTDLRYLLKIHF